MVPAFIPQPPAARQPVPHDAVRQSVAQILIQSSAFKAMPLSAQEEIAKNTALVADYLARPEGIDARRLDRPRSAAAATARALEDTDHSATEATWDQKQAAVDAVGKDRFRADAAREGAAVAGELLKNVNFTDFVSGLINGVFKSIADTSIRQMEAYQKMIASVATSLHQFMDDHVDQAQGRDHMVEQFPDLFEVGQDDFGDTPKERMKLREGVDEEEALAKVNNKLQFENGALKSLDLSDENVEKALVENSRLQLARQRQQLMASIVLMGINRIVVTDGKISAKIIYDVKASDRLTKRRSASAVDVARNQDGTVQMDRSVDRTWDNNSKYQRSGDDFSADHYAKGEYKYDEQPIITMQTAASETNDASMQTKIQLSGVVDVNFKSDYLPLDKMATPQMIASIQGNASPADPNVVPSPRAAPAAATIAPAPIAVQ